MSRKILISATRGPAMRSYAASCIDIACKPLVINQSWLYAGHPDTAGMKEALAELLNEYPTVAGRISGDGITCSNAGVLWEDTAVPDISVKDMPRQTMPGKVFHAMFDNKAALSGNFPLLSVKVSRLEDGTVLNVRCSHFCADGNSFYSMMGNWASLTRGEGFVRKPVYDDTAVSRALEASEAYAIPAPYGKKAAEALMEREGMFRIRPDVMLRMVWQKLLRIDRRLSAPVFVPYPRIDSVRDASLMYSGNRAGRNAALSAITVELLKQRMDWAGKTIGIVHTADHRGRIDCIGPDYTGNASFTLRPTTISADLPAGQMAALIDGDMKRMLAPECERRYFALYHAMLERKMLYLPFDISSMWCARPTTFIINNCLKFNIYGLDFGEGGPVFAWPLDFGDPVRFWPAPPEENGVYVYFTGVFAC